MGQNLIERVPNTVNEKDFSGRGSKCPSVGLPNLAVELFGKDRVRSGRAERAERSGSRLVLCAFWTTLLQPTLHLAFVTDDEAVA